MLMRWIRMRLWMIWGTIVFERMCIAIGRTVLLWDAAWHAIVYVYHEISSVSKAHLQRVYILTLSRRRSGP